MMRERAKTNGKRGGWRPYESASSTVNHDITRFCGRLIDERERDSEKKNEILIFRGGLRKILFFSGNVFFFFYTFDTRRVRPLQKSWNAGEVIRKMPSSADCIARGFYFFPIVRFSRTHSGPAIGARMWRTTTAPPIPKFTRRVENQFSNGQK